MTTLRRAIPLALVPALLLAGIPLPTGEASGHDDYALRATIVSPTMNATFGWIASVSVLVENEDVAFDVELWVDDTLLMTRGLVESELDDDGTLVTMQFNTTRFAPGEHALRAVVRTTLRGAAMSQPVTATFVDAPLPVVTLERVSFRGDTLLLEGYVGSPIRSTMTLFAWTPHGWTSAENVRNGFSLEIPLGDAPLGASAGFVHASDARGNNGTLEFTFRVVPPTVLLDRVFDGPVLATFEVPAAAAGEVRICSAAGPCRATERVSGVVAVSVDGYACVAESQGWIRSECAFQTDGRDSGVVSGHTLLPTRVVVTAYL